MNTLRCPRCHSLPIMTTTADVNHYLQCDRACFAIGATEPWDAIRYWNIIIEFVLKSPEFYRNPFASKTEKALFRAANNLDKNEL